MTRRWLLATSNSWRRFVDAETHVPVLEPIVNPVDGHPDLFMAEGVGPLVEAAPELRASLRECAAIVKAEVDNLVDAHTSPITGTIDDPDDQEYIEKERAIYCRAVAAIHKAEGRKP